MTYPVIRSKTKQNEYRLPNNYHAAIRLLMLYYYSLQQQQNKDTVFATTTKTKTPKFPDYRPFA